MAKVIEFAEKRLNEEIKENQNGASNSGLMAYWSAYLDGVKAQKKEDEEFKKKSDDIIATVECKTVAFLNSVSAFAKDMDELFTEYLKANAEIEAIFEEKKANAEV